MNYCVYPLGSSSNTSLFLLPLKVLKDVGVPRQLSSRSIIRNIDIMKNNTQPLKCILLAFHASKHNCSLGDGMFLNFRRQFSCANIGVHFLVATVNAPCACRLLLELLSIIEQLQRDARPSTTLNVG